MDHRSSGLGWKSSAGNWQNAAFYDYSANGFTAMAGVTTKGGAFDTTSLVDEGNSGTKTSYGLALKYEAANFAIGAGYQRDNGQTTAGFTDSLGALDAVKSEWGVGGKYTFSPVTVALSYADAKLMSGAKERRIHSTISGKLTPNDTLFVNYLNDKVKDSGMTYKKETRYGLGYIHAMSKRTEVFANVGRIRESVSDTKSTSWDIGLRHSF
jgi:predicted porin